eukprot:scaffold236570_cov13-Tisochrysis_lutea.AAC.1
MPSCRLAVAQRCRALWLVGSKVAATMESCRQPEASMAFSLASALRDTQEGLIWETVKEGRRFGFAHSRSHPHGLKLS